MANFAICQKDVAISQKDVRGHPTGILTLYTCSAEAKVWKMNIFG